MPSLLKVSVILLLANQLDSCVATSTPLAVDNGRDITYQGISSNGVENFLNIPYGKDTSGARRFAPPLPLQIPNGSVINAMAEGPVCPQEVAGGFAYNSNATYQSEDCLKLRVARPANLTAGAKLPVMVYIYGGGLFDGNINERTASPNGLILESVANGFPLIYVAMNYRLNIFGFALSEALRVNNSLNVGLRDQRLALEWVQDNIAVFGGDPDRVTIFGQSSGALSVSLQILAYGGSKGAPFHGAIIESTALEPTMTSNLTLDTFNAVSELSGCSSGDPQSDETLECLRSLPFESLLNTTIAQQDSTSDDNDGDTYLPAVDGDFLPKAASQLTKEGLFTPMPVIIGWTEDDATLFTPEDITTSADTLAFMKLYWPALTNSSLSTILSLYPTTDFSANPSANLSAEFYRSAQIFRDILLTCPSFYFGHAMASKCESIPSPYPLPNATTNASNSSTCPNVYLYIQNQTILDPYLASIGNPGLGVIHTSELPYVFGNLSLYNVSNAYDPNPSDFSLMHQISRSWSSFSNFGEPTVAGKDTLRGWGPAYKSGGGGGVMDASVYVIGGPGEGMSRLEGRGAKEAVGRQRLVERCGFFNSEEVVRQLQY
ncbi:alpha/beta-hydrolase [Saccharata proteae CBS 121410]|uniref:Carboxylic ester hydrolase n=1 Tax=Saccharata proteae CBS 121410 TaxID=1314787 RepID=A0A9P4LRJ8_9PEZI|nr:alpha/beta-hydrolase [Saccharata proteae CBS 121410]